MATASVPDLDVVKPGDNIVLDCNGEKLAFIKIKEGSTVRVGNNTCSVAPIIGAPFGTAFLLDEDKELCPTEINPLDEIETASHTDKSNEALIAGANQTLTDAEVAQLKEELHGADIVKALESGSTTFASKTEFSQEKWRKKKTKKYLHYVTVRRPSSRIICEAMFTKLPSRVFNLRPDSLAVLMSMANVGPHARVLCVDATGGVVAAACVERMGGFGTLCCAHAEPKAYPLDATRQLNMPACVARSARHVRLAALLQAAAAAAVTADTAAAGAAADDAAPAAEVAAGDGGTAAEAADAAAQVADPPAQPAAEPAARIDVGAGGDAAEGDAGETEPLRVQKVRVKLHAEVPEGAPLPDRMVPADAEETALIAEQGFTSLVVCAPRLDYCKLVPLLLPLLRPSAAVALFAPAMQPLVECYSALQTTKQFLSLQVQESWWREIQVLPSRTHPMMTMSGTGGYLLSGVRVLPPDAAEADAARAAGAGSNKRSRTHRSPNKGNKRQRA